MKPVADRRSGATLSARTMDRFVTEPSAGRILMFVPGGDRLGIRLTSGRRGGATVTAKDTGVFVTDTGEEISVRTIAHHTPTAMPTVEPLYGTDAELMDGATGELRRKTGERWRGTLRRQGNAFALHTEPAAPTVLEKATRTPPAVSHPPRRATLADKPQEPTRVAAAPPRRAKRRDKAPEAAPLVVPPVLPAEPAEHATEAAPTQAEATEALEIVARFIRADGESVIEREAAPPRAASHTPPSQAEAIEAGRTVAQFLRGDGTVDLELAKHAQAIVSEFIAERGRQITAPDE